MAIDGLPIEAIERAATAYIKGEVPGHKAAFAPSCAEFAEQCRFQQMSIAAERSPRIEPPEEKPQPKVSAEKLKLLKDATNGSLSARKKLAAMFPDNPIIARAATEDGNKEAAE